MSATPPRRRLLLAGGAAALAAAATGVFWQQRAERQRAEAAAALAEDTAGFWQLRFPTPDGGELATASLRGHPMVLNFWGSWCPPCVKEMPDLDRFAREHPAWRVLGLAVDNPRAVRDFLARQPVGYAIAMAGFDGSELARQLGNTQGGLPFTVFFDRAGRVWRRKTGETHFAELAAWAREMGA
jgi:thiol-disulfide isomerase/thioredoxin